jgi:hypothetical protein
MSTLKRAQLSQPHSHTGYKIALVALLISVAALGASLALIALPNTIFKTGSIPPGFTFLHGTVKISSGLGTPKAIQFRPTATDTLSTTISSDGNFQITLHSNVLYGVSIYAGNSFICTANPNTIVPSGSDYTQDFTC